MQHSLRRRVQDCLLLVPMQHRLLVGGAAFLLRLLQHCLCWCIAAAASAALFTTTSAAGAALFAASSSAARFADTAATVGAAFCLLLWLVQQFSCSWLVQPFLLQCGLLRWLLLMQHSLRRWVQYCLLLVPMQHRLLSAAFC
jgi:hypothetical protein